VRNISAEATTMTEGEQHRVDGLGEEQRGDPLDVADDAATLGDDVRERGEPVVQQHDRR
jgi:hypothetical protein